MVQICRSASASMPVIPSRRAAARCARWRTSRGKVRTSGAPAWNRRSALRA